MQSFLIAGTALAMLSMCCFSAAIYYGINSTRQQTVTIQSVTPEIDLTGMTGGIAFIPGRGMMVWDVNKYDLKVVER